MTLRVKIIMLIVAIAAVIGLAFLFTAAKTTLTSGKLNVTTSDAANYITVSRINPNPTVIDTKNAQGTYSAQLPDGTYTVTVQNKSYSTQQIVTVKAGQTISASIDLVKAGPLEIVTSLGVTSVVAGSDTLRYIDTDSDALFEINKLNQLHYIASPSPFTSVVWASATYGIARNGDGQFYRVDGSTITPLTAPFPLTNLSNSYAVSPNKDVYLTDGSKVYRGAGGQNFQAIVTSSKRISIKAASDTNVLVQESDPKNAKAAASLILINHVGNTIRTEGEVYDAAFSPSGNHIVINGAARSAVLDNKLQQIIRLPQNNVTSPAWVNDNTLVYAQQNKLWQFNTINGQADMIANTDIAAIIQQSVSADGAYVYMTTQNISDGLNPMLERVGLKKQPVAQDVTVLGLILPATVDACRLSFVNFTAPTVAIQGPKGGQAACTQKAQQYLQTYHVSSTIGISFSGN
jgi:hypothetical protein